MTQIVRKRPRSGCTKRTFFTAAGQKDRARRSPPSAFGARRWSRRSSRRKRGSVRRDAGAVLNVETCGKRSIGMEGDAEDQLLERRLVNWGRWARDTYRRKGRTDRQQCRALDALRHAPRPTGSGDLRGLLHEPSAPGVRPSSKVQSLGAGEESLGEKNPTHLRELPAKAYDCDTIGGDYYLELTGNEARLIFLALKNKKSVLAENVREKLIRASEKNFLKRQHAELNRKDNGQKGNTD